MNPFISYRVTDSSTPNSMSLSSGALSQSCGQSSFDPTPRLAASYIVGGQFASLGDFPWQVRHIYTHRIYLSRNKTYINIKREQSNYRELNYSS